MARKLVEEDAMSDTYVFYRHKNNPTYRLVLKQNAPFPSETSPDQWIEAGHHGEDHVSEETQFEVERNGFKLYKLAASFDEFQPSLAALAG
jgi:hypothetical protein